ncbi:glycosyltransferase [Lactiplantibacillus paraplantarum]|uniref:glycosyltransferase n=1 Tax=Lactiplantibacillus paraplantarum TaxID=60520 RepID=UPI003B27CF1B
MKKKMAFLIPQFYWGGMPHVASQLILLLEDEYDITLILVNNRLDIRIDTYSANVIRLQGSGLKKLVELYHLLKREQFLTVLSFGVIDNLLNIIISPSKTRTVITEHSTKSFENALETSNFKKRIYSFGIKHLYSKATAVIAVSNGIKEDLERYYHLKNIHVIYNPLQINDRFRELSTKDRSLVKLIRSENGKIVLNVGRITGPKGQLNLVKSFKNLKNKNIHLVLIGEGPDSEAIEDYIKTNNMTAFVHLIGTRSNVLTWMKNSDLYATLSWFEGFPGVLVESVYSRLPVLSPDNYSGPREILSQGRTSEYSQQLSYPVCLSNGILTERFDFRERRGEFTSVENQFAHYIAQFIDYKKDCQYKPSLEFIDNNEVRMQYINLINGSEVN